MMFLRPSTSPMKIRMLNRQRIPIGHGFTDFKRMWPGRALPTTLLDKQKHLAPGQVTFRVLNPLLEPFYEYAFGTGRTNYKNAGGLDEPRDSAYLGIDIAIQGSSSCLDMYVTDPPCQRMECGISYSIWHEDWCKRPSSSTGIYVEVENASGVKIADIVKALLLRQYRGMNSKDARAAQEDVCLTDWRIPGDVGSGWLAVIPKGGNFQFPDNTLLVTAEEMAAL